MKNLILISAMALSLSVFSMDNTPLKRVSSAPEQVHIEQVLGMMSTADFLINKLDFELATANLSAEEREQKMFQKEEYISYKEHLQFVLHSNDPVKICNLISRFQANAAPVVTTSQIITPEV